jgi:hypothetical protein
MALRASLGRLKLVLLLEVRLPLPERPDMDVPGRPPVLEIEVRREDGPDVSAFVGDADAGGENERALDSSTGDLG